ncbi:hypothetical protein N9R54_04900 [Pelobium sp.]|nr:hypothetical protein [Pelobium sp.]MDA9555555.1 hypothetical protein [Pelobium sp.]
MTSKKLFILIPYLNQNTTSVNRLQSFIHEALERKDVDVNVIYFDFSTLDKISIGIDGELSSITNLFKDKIIHLQPNLNFLQSFSFWFLKRGYIKLFKILTIFHQILYLSDVFTVHKVNKQLQDLHINSNDTFVALGGPFGLFKTTYNIHKRYKVKLILDYRDPWTYGYPPIDGSSLFHLFKQKAVRKLENKILSAATLIFTVSESLKNFFPKKYQSKVFVIPNAANYFGVKIETAPKTFDIVYLGTIYNIQLKDETLFRAISKWAPNKSNVRILFLGSNNSHLLKPMIEKYGLTENTIITKRLGKEAIKPYLENASLFLHLKYGNRKEIITSKQADYLIFRKPILIPVSDEGDIAESITKNNAGYVCYSEPEILTILNKLYDKFLARSVEIIDKNELNTSYTREFWAKKFVDKILTPPSL